MACGSGLRSIAEVFQSIQMHNRGNLPAGMCRKARVTVTTFTGACLAAGWHRRRAALLAEQQRLNV